jgi:hypothetical protein
MIRELINKIRSEKYGWWLNELESLGVNTLEKNGLNNHKEASTL